MGTQARAQGAGRIEITRVSVKGFLAALTRHVQGDAEAEERSRLVYRERTLARNLSDMTASLDEARRRVSMTPEHLDRGERKAVESLTGMLASVRSAHDLAVSQIAGRA